MRTRYLQVGLATRLTHPVVRRSAAMPGGCGRGGDARAAVEQGAHIQRPAAQVLACCQRDSAAPHRRHQLRIAPGAPSHTSVITSRHLLARQPLRHIFVFTSSPSCRQRQQPGKQAIS